MLFNYYYYIKNIMFSHDSEKGKILFLLLHINIIVQYLLHTAPLYLYCPYNIAQYTIYFSRELRTTHYPRPLYCNIIMAICNIS